MDAKQREFILLRADGISFDKIATQLKVSKSTLIQWSKLFETEIKELQFHALAEIKEAYSFNLKSKYETMLKQLQKIDDAILEADLSNTALKDLAIVKTSLFQNIEAIEKKISVDARVTSTNDLGYKEQLRLSLFEV